MQRTLPAILNDGLALGYLAQHLREQHLSRSLQFWLICRTLREVALPSSVFFSFFLIFFFFLFFFLFFFTLILVQLKERN